MRRLVLLAFLAAACGDSNYGKAAIGTGVAITAVGLYRALTHGCWAQCQKGYLCNHATGLCERGECTPPCAVGSHCAMSRHGSLLCEPDPGTLDFGAARRPAPAPTDGGAAGDAGVGIAAPR